MANDRASRTVWPVITIILLITLACGPSTVPNADATQPDGVAEVAATQTETPAVPASAAPVAVGKVVPIDDVTITVNGFATSWSGGGLGGDSGIVRFDWLDLYLFVRVSITCNKPEGDACALIDYGFGGVDAAGNRLNPALPVFPPGVMENLDTTGPFLDALLGSVPGGTTSEGLMPIMISDHGIDLSTFDPKTFDFDGFWSGYTDGFHFQYHNSKTGSQLLFSVK
jgi:hypothetical protein